MFVPLLILHVILFLSPLTIIASGEAPIAKPNCTSSCGNINIPYPFGIEPDCYADEWFKILCTNSKVPMLNSTNSEVIEIYANGTLKVKNPITFKNCRGGTFQQAANLTGSPFVFSQTRNRFTAVSCGVLALMKSDDNNNSKTIGACMSICDTSSGAETSCNGMNCCQTTIPPNLTVFSTEFEDNMIRGGVCMYAFLVDRDWLDGRSKKFADIIRDQMEAVPVVLEWSLYSWPMEDFREALNTTRNDPSWVQSTSYCEIGDISSINNQSIRLQCFCKPGFEGNPYVKKGCQGWDFKAYDNCYSDDNCVPYITH